MNKGRHKSGRLLFYLVFASILTLVVIISSHTGFLQGFERRLLDFRFVNFNRQLEPSDEIVFVDVDDISLETLSQQIGGWPWPRGTVMADLIINYIMAGDPSTVIMDILYSTLSPKPPGAPISEEDLWMADISSIYPNLSHAVLFTNETFNADKEVRERMAEVFSVEVEERSPEIDLPEYNFYLGPYEPLASVTNMLHAVNHREDPDGISRHNQILLNYQGTYYPGLVLRALIEHAQVDRIVLEVRQLRLLRGDRTLHTVPLTEDGDYPLNFYPDLNRFAAFPADNVIASAQSYFFGEGEVQVPLEEFEDKIVIVGSSALGLRDIKVTPLGNNVGGPYIHMTAISNILENHHLRGIPAAVSVLLTVVLILAVLGATTALPGGSLRAVVGGVIILAWIATALLLFRQFGIAVEMAATLTTLVLAYIGGLAFTSLQEGAEKNRITGVMGKYLAPAVMNEVLDNYDELIGEVGEERELTILFSDIRSFSSISESYTAPQVVEVLNRYLEQMIAVVFERRGTLDKIIGDAIMAFWGAPNPEANKEQLAVETALEMVKLLPGLNRILEAEQLPTVRIGVGVHTGSMIVGNIGSAQRLDYTAIGDNVNLGSRLEGLTKYYRYPVLVSEPTYRPLAENLPFVFVDTVAVKGKKQGIGIYAPLDPQLSEATEADSSVPAQFVEARAAYGRGEFRRGFEIFSRLAAAHHPLAGTAAIFRDRCARFLDSPPEEGWSGVWAMTEK